MTDKELFDQSVAQIPARIRMQHKMSFAIADNIDALLRKNGVERKELATAMNVRPARIAEWLSGQHNFSLKTIARIAEYFGVTTEQLLSV